MGLITNISVIFLLIVKGHYVDDYTGVEPAATDGIVGMR